MSQVQDPRINGEMPAAPCDRFPGLTKREAFAAQFMAAYLAADAIGEPREDLASAAVSAADALLLQLSKAVSA